MQVKAFEVAKLLEQRRRSGGSWIEFLRMPALSMGVYSLPAGAPDEQKPHWEDEVYYVVGGRGRIRVGAEDHPVGPGSVVFVAGKAKHQFHSITEDLDVLVFFAPAENADAPPPEE